MPTKATVVRFLDTPEEASWHHVARTIGGRTVEELQKAMGQREFVEWVAFLNLEAQQQELSVKAAGGK